MGFKSSIREFLGIRDLENNLNELKGESKKNQEENINKLSEESKAIIGEINGNFEKIIPSNDEQELKEMVIVDPFNKKELISLDFVNHRELNDIEKYEYIGPAGRLLALCQNIPLAGAVVGQDKLLEGAYRIIMPDGVVGNLMEYKNGLLGTPLMGNKGIVGHAGLESITSNFSVTPLMIFTGLSMVTGQYFLANINKTLKSLDKGVKEILSVFMDDKESGNLAIYNFLNELKENFEVIMKNNELKQSYMVSLKNKNIELDQNFIFYKKRIERKIEELEQNVFESKFTNKRTQNYNKEKEEIESLINQLELSSLLFAIGQIYEIQLGQEFNEDYLEFKSEVINKMVSNKETLEIQILKRYVKTIVGIDIKAVRDSRLLEDEREKLVNVFSNRCSQFRENMNEMQDTIEKIKIMNNRENQIFINDKGIYYLK